MNRATRIKLAATAAADKHRDTCGLPTISYSYLAGCLEAHITALCDELQEFTPPKSGKTERETTYAHDGGELVVHFDFEPGEDSTRDYPGCPESVAINGVFANGMNVTDLLGAGVLERIEEHCLEQIDTDVADAEYDRAEERYQSRRDYGVTGNAGSIHAFIQQGATA